MRKNFGAKPFLYPQPVLVIASCDKDGTPDAMNAAWGGIAGGDKIFLCLSSNHKTVENILERKAFTVSVADEAHLVEADYVGAGLRKRCARQAGAERLPCDQERICGRAGDRRAAPGAGVQAGQL